MKQIDYVYLAEERKSLTGLSASDSWRIIPAHFVAARLVRLNDTTIKLQFFSDFEGKYTDGIDMQTPDKEHADDFMLEKLTDPANIFAVAE